MTELHGSAALGHSFLQLQAEELCALQTTQLGWCVVMKNYVYVLVFHDVFSKTLFTIETHADDFQSRFYPCFLAIWNFIHKHSKIQTSFSSSRLKVHSYAWWSNVDGKRNWVKSHAFQPAIIIHRIIPTANGENCIKILILKKKKCHPNWFNKVSSWNINSLQYFQATWEKHIQRGNSIDPTNGTPNNSNPANNYNILVGLSELSVVQFPNDLGI